MFLVVRFPDPWPPASRNRVLEVRRGSVSLQLVAELDGSLSASVVGANGRIEHRTQRVELTGRGWAILSVRWTAGLMDVQINAQPLLAYEAANGESRLIRTTDHPAGVEPAWLDPTVSTECAEWVKRRGEKFGTIRKPKRSGRRPKTSDEQVNELRRSAQILIDLSTLIQQGRFHLLGHLAAELRALLYWNGPTYDPLLLRLANARQAALPIYVIPEKELPPTLPDGLSHHFRRGEPSITRVNPAQRVVDLQEWLQSEVLWEEDGCTPIALDVKGVIAGVADTLGAAHYDPDVPISIERLGAIKGPVADEVTMILLSCASLVVSLIQYIVGEGHSPPNTR